MDKELLEELFAKALATLIEQNGGSMEQALDDIGVQDERDRKPIKEWFGWEEETDEQTWRRQLLCVS